MPRGAHAGRPDGCPPGDVAALGPHFPDAADVSAGPPALAFSAGPDALPGFNIRPCQDPSAACSSVIVVQQPPGTDPSPGGGGTFPGNGTPNP
jgi:hypothetical protein